MSELPSHVRHVVAWLQPARWATSIVLWAMLLVLWLFPQLDVSLRGIGMLALAVAICRTAVVLACHRGGAAPPLLLGIALVADAALLTGLLDITGGPFNPFIVMYAAYIWVAAVAVSPAWAAAAVLVSLAGFGWLVVDHWQAGLIEHHRLNDFPTHLFTMWFSGAGMAELVAHYVGRARATLAQRQAQLDEARERAVRSERLASLTTLAAGAAHELSTPLATIAVAARELERMAARVSEPRAVGAALEEDARLIRSELDRCEAILDSMSGRAGAGAATALEPMSPASIARLVRERLAADQRQQLSVRIEPGTPNPAATGAEVVQAVSSLIKNACEATGRGGGIALRFAPRGAMVRIEVQDRGAGMSADTRHRAGEPFFTTKEPGRGIGLGLFLVRTFAERSGGRLEFDGTDGTTAILEIPALAQDAPVVA
jgi:two-component system sensor histidine kinase RegB